jgi:glycosyltransferase involved in cell wall biosynthesis
MSLRVVAYTPQPGSGASSRYRVYQMVEALRAEGVELSSRPFFDEASFARLHRAGQLGGKALDLARRTARRWSDLSDAGNHDVALVHRELWPLAGDFMQARLASRQPRWVFDFDDAVFLPNVSEANRAFGDLKAHRSAASLAAGATAVSAGNAWLASWARSQRPKRSSSDVSVIPTAVDTRRWKPRVRTPGASKLVWIGSPTTVGYLAPLAPALARLARKHPDLELHCVGAEFKAAGVRCVSHAWSEASEVEHVASGDIGLAPLPDTPWARGKCGLKLLLYLALGLPVVASNAGVHPEIVVDGENGLLAGSDEAFESAIERLIEDRELRTRLSLAGPRTVEAGYSVHAVAPRLARVLKQAAEGPV